MNRTTAILAPLTICIAAAAAAHQGVRNAEVLARMENMTAISDEMEILVNMARGVLPHDPSTAEAARERLAALAAEVVPLFEAPATDPAMEAIPVLWDEVDQFAEKAHAMERTISDLSGTLSDPETVREAVAALSRSCTACHDAYREAD